MFAQYYSHPMMDNQDWGWGWFMMFFWVILIIGAIIIVVQLLKSHGSDSTKQLSPLDIAKKRYAKGEIKKDEFEQIKKDLK